MRNRKKRIDPIPDEFGSYQEAAEFWNSRDTTDYPEAFHTVEAEVEFKERHYEVEVDEDIVMTLRKEAKGRLAQTSGQRSIEKTDAARAIQFS